MEDLIAAQQDLSRRISRTGENLKKSGQQNITINLVRSTLAVLDSRWARFEEQHATLLRNHKPALKGSAYLSEDLMDQTEQQYLAQRSNLLDLEWRLSTSTTEKPVTTASAPSADGSTVNHTTQAQSYPRIDLPKFNGRFEDWPSFRDLFKSMVIDEATLPEVRKLHYLKTSVTGEAECLLRNMATTADNFKRAWTTLSDHYNNPRLLVRSYLNNFTTLPKMRAGSITDLKRIFHGVTDTVSALEGVGRPVTSSEDLFVHLVVNLFDHTTMQEWDKTVRKSSEPPSLAVLLGFLKEQVTSEGALEGRRTEATPKATPRSGRTVRIAQQTPNASSTGRACPFCNGDHFILACRQYRGKTPQGRLDLLTAHNRCISCLGRHSVANCIATKVCRRCSGQHHTSVHEAFSAFQSANAPTTSTLTASQRTSPRAAVLLATARVWVRDSAGREHSVRALVDSGSETSLVAESLVQRIRLPRSHSKVAVFGVGGQRSGVARGRVTLTLAAHARNHTLTVSALVLPRLSAYNGLTTVDYNTWPHAEGLQLADPQFAAQDPVEILLGADAYATIIMSGIRRGRKDEPIAQRTALGWILMGAVKELTTTPVTTALHCSTEESLSIAIRRFWEWEEPASITLPLTPDERRCEQFFRDTVKRLPDGRFQVRLPFRVSPPPPLHDTKHVAARMLNALTMRLSRDGAFGLQYKRFMSEYAQLGHMSPVAPLPCSTGSSVCYLPHHGVTKSNGSSTKLRVVFNGSARSATGTSLNDCLHTGPTLLPRLPDIILRWRRHQFAIVADIEKMYRQIVVHPDDRNYQRILWQSNGGCQEFQLNTVTYGTACAPYLAIRVLHQLADEESSQFSGGAAVLRNDCYVDDILTGSSTVASCRQLQQELTALCTAGGFPLRKWAGNHPAVLHGIPMSHRLAASDSAALPSEEHSVLGLRWDPRRDTLSVAVTDLPHVSPTKRIVLSHAAKLFDPLGWLAPVVLIAKLLIQTTWLQQLEWDTPLAHQEAEEWRKLVEELPTLQNLRIPRWFRGFGEQGTVEIHGFSDASERAFGAVVYLRMVHAGQVAVSFVQAKTKVAPLKQVSLPRLELCGAVLLSKLSAQVREALGLSTAPTYHWCDSTVTLAWIRGHPTKWNTFVANRVVEIQRHGDAVIWRHVPGCDNPADCASRGMLPHDLAAHTLWWHGPSFLQEDSSRWPKGDDLPTSAELPDQRPPRCLTVSHETPEAPELTRFSNLRRLLRVTSWILRWRTRRSRDGNATDNGNREFLDSQEIEDALLRWIRITQVTTFAPELEDVRAGRAVHGRSALRKLTPFLDADGLLRVGGRLKHSLLDSTQKHPIILPAHSHLSSLIVEAHHRRTLHGGTQATLASIRQRFWLLRGRQLVKKTIHRCPTCLRWRAATPQPIMSPLPASRIRPSRPFLHTGVDYAGPIRIRSAKGRGHHAYKGFLVIFVCFSSRAVHLELASDYTASAFIAAFRRFSSRRGLPVAMYSDRGTNFVGATRELRFLFSTSSSDGQRIAGHLADRGVRWIFNPPAAPHFGGLWEAAVRSVKFHLRRVIGDASLTFEEMSTLLAEIEACLNSRPLQPMSDDPEDTSALTPGHFLIGEPLSAIPEVSLLDTSPNRLTRWRLLQQMRDHFWDRWSREYLQTLIPRPKWWRTTGGVKEGQLCLIKDETIAPTRWPLARIVRLHKGRDAQVRVADVKTMSGLLTRPVIKLVPLPSTSSPNNDDSVCSSP